MSVAPPSHMRRTYLKTASQTVAHARRSHPPYPPVGATYAPRLVAGCAAAPKPSLCRASPARRGASPPPGICGRAGGSAGRSPGSCAPAATRGLPQHGDGRPDLFSSAEAARNALIRENPGQMPIEEYLIGVCPGFLSASYRRGGRRGPAGRRSYTPPSSPRSRGSRAHRRRGGSDVTWSPASLHASDERGSVVLLVQRSGRSGPCAINGRLFNSPAPSYSLEGSS